MILMTQDLLFFVHDFQSLGILAVSITTPILQVPVDYFQYSDGVRVAAIGHGAEGPLVADCRLIEARLSLACIQNSAREFDAE
jgi:hypothetical protein